MIVYRQHSTLCENCGRKNVGCFLMEFPSLCERGDSPPKLAACDVCLYHSINRGAPLEMAEWAKRANGGEYHDTSKLSVWRRLLNAFN